MNNNEILPTFSAEQFAAIFAGTIKAIVKDEVNKALEELNAKISSLDEKIDSIDSYSQEQIEDVSNKLNSHINDCDFGTDYDDEIEDIKSRLEDVEDKLNEYDFEEIVTDTSDALNSAERTHEELEEIRDNFTDKVREALLNIAAKSDNEVENG